MNKKKIPIYKDRLDLSETTFDYALYYINKYFILDLYKTNIKNPNNVIPENIILIIDRANIKNAERIKKYLGQLFPKTFKLEILIKTFKNKKEWNLIIDGKNINLKFIGRK
ncbi:MAG: hypothetical protein ACFFD1_00170 [Candidatus Thorarchaeota archaeon]